MEHVGKDVPLIDLDDETTNHDGNDAKFTIPEVPGVAPTIVEKAVHSLEHEDSQWDEARLHRRIGEYLVEANLSSGNVDTMQTLDWDTGLDDMVAATELDDSTPRPSEVPDKAGLDVMYVPDIATIENLFVDDSQNLDAR